MPNTGDTAVAEGSLIHKAITLISMLRVQQWGKRCASKGVENYSRRESFIGINNIKKILNGKLLELRSY